MKKTSRKTVKRADRKSVSYRLTAVEDLRVAHELKTENQGRTPATLTAYAKHALLDHHRLAAIEGKVRNLKEIVGNGDNVNADWVAEQLGRILDQHPRVSA